MPDAGFVLIHRKPGTDEGSQFLVGKFGRASWAPQTPASSRDIYFEEVWPADAHGRISNEFAVRRGVWIDSTQIDALFFMDPPATQSPFHQRINLLMREGWRRARGQSAHSPASPPEHE